MYYDPYDVGIHADPYPVFRQLREEAPLYYNDRYDFFALSRFDDVEKGLVDHATFSSARRLVQADRKPARRAPARSSAAPRDQRDGAARAAAASS